MHSVPHNHPMVSCFSIDVQFKRADKKFPLNDFLRTFANDVSPLYMSISAATYISLLKSQQAEKDGGGITASRCALQMVRSDC